MKAKHVLLVGLAAALLLPTLATRPAAAYSVLLPDVQPSPSLPYVAEKDHYSGPAGIQMILNSCPNTAARHYHDQDNIYISIMLHNAEPATWFSDPSGIKGVLEDTAFSPCGHWVDYSNTNKHHVLGKMLYYMKTQRYLTPVSIGSTERWVAVIGYQTDVEPPYSGPVTLQNIFFYDPLPGNPSYGWVTGTVWLSDSVYWGVPLSKTGSSWHGKYIAIIEPPEAGPMVRVFKRILRGPILPPERIERYFYYRWLGEARKEIPAQGPFRIIHEDFGIERPILVKTPDYSYYLMFFKDHRLAAIFNAYDGSFEELRYFERPQRYVTESKVVRSILSKALRQYKAEVVEMSTPEIRYDQELPGADRFSPRWEVRAVVRDARGTVRRVPVSVSATGQLTSSLDELETDRQKTKM